VALGLEETQKGLANLVARPNFARCPGLSHSFVTLALVYPNTRLRAEALSGRVTTSPLMSLRGESKGFLQGLKPTGCTRLRRG